MLFFNKTALKNIKSIDNRYNEIYTVDEELLNFTIGGGSTCTNILQSVLFVNIPISERKETVNSTHIVVLCVPQRRTQHIKKVANKMKKISIFLAFALITVLLCPAVNATADETETFEYYEYNPETQTEELKTLTISDSSPYSSKERREYDEEGNLDTRWMPDTAGSEDGVAFTGTGVLSTIAKTDDPTQYNKITSTTSRPYKYIGIIKYYRSTDEDGEHDWKVATAFLEGPNVLVTSAHCCYKANDGGWADDLYYYPARNGSDNPCGEAQRYSILVPSSWKNSNDYNYDWSIVTLKTAIGNTTGYFGKKWTSSSYVGTSVTMTGYPYTTELSNNVYYMYSSSGSVDNNTTYKLFSTYNSNNCASGSPIYVYQNGSYIAVGVHSGREGSNARASRITEYFYNLLQEKLDAYLDSQA